MDASLSDALLSFHMECTAIHAADGLRDLALKIAEAHPSHKWTAHLVEHAQAIATLAEEFAPHAIYMLGLPKGEPPIDITPLLEVPTAQAEPIDSQAETDGDLPWPAQDDVAAFNREQQYIARGLQPNGTVDGVHFPSELPLPDLTRP